MLATLKSMDTRDQDFFFAWCHSQNVPCMRVKRGGGYRAAAIVPVDSQQTVIFMLVWSSRCEFS
jgi:hypothetical protein